MRTYRVTLVGKTPLIMHQDNIEWADRMELWKKDPRNKAASKPGDDRTPPFRWLGAMYHDGQRMIVPSDNVMASFMRGGALLPTGKGQKTFKAQTQSGMMAPDLHWALTVDGKEIPVGGLIKAGFEAVTYEEWNAIAADLGFLLFLKRVKIGNMKHIRVRPRFNRWTLTGSLIVTDEAITAGILQQIGDGAGQYAGLCDWRPGSRTPGPFGMYEFRVEKA